MEQNLGLICLTAVLSGTGHAHGNHGKEVSWFLVSPGTRGDSSLSAFLTLIQTLIPTQF